MAIAWFTDPNQLRQSLYDEFQAYFGDDPDSSIWKADPIREQCGGFLQGVLAIVEAVTEATPKEEVVQQFNEHIRLNVARFLNIPDSLYQYPSQTPGAQPQNGG